MKRSYNLLTVFVLSLSMLLVVVSGCKPADDGTRALLDTTVSSLKIDDLARSVDFLKSERRFELKEFSSKVAAGLNRWKVTEEETFATDGWELNGDIDPLIQEYAGLRVCDEVSQMSFSNGDAFYAQQCMWFHQLAGRLIESKMLGPFEMYRLAADGYVPDQDEDTDDLVVVLNQLHNNLEEEQATDLANGMKIFDWIVRNIQLLSADNPADAVLDDDLTPEELRNVFLLNSEAEENDNASAGIPGPGYTRFAWQTLMYSRGDFIERARLFALMGQQVGLEVVMLGLGEDRTPWCAALAIGDNYYLFDTKLALPIPGKNPGSIATLADVVADPSLLRVLDLTVDESLEENTAYRVSAEDLENITAMVIVAPEAVSRRFANMKKSMGIDESVVLSLNPTEMMDRLPEMDGLKKEIWNIEFETHRFRNVVTETILNLNNRQELTQKLAWHFINEQYIDGFPNIRTSRCRYFRGKFNATTEKEGRGAIESFYTLMYSDQTIADLAIDKNLQRQLGLFEAGDAAAFQSRVRSVQGQMKLIRHDAGYFLSQCHFDNGNIGTAANWLERLRDATGVERWINGMDYLRARAYEGRGEYERAIEALKVQKGTPQYAGNLIRARLLSEMIEAE